MEERIQKDIMSAMKEKDEVRLAALRAVKTAIMQTKTSPNFKGNRDANLPDADVLKIMQKLAKEREEAFNIYISAGRNDLAAIEEYEYKFLETLLPKEPTEDEIKEAIAEAIAGIDTPTMKNMKDVMNFVKGKYPTVNGGVVSKLFKEMIS